MSYRTLAQRLAAEFGIEPSNETRQLHRSLGAAKATGAEDFVGRSAELRQLTAVLAQEDCRLVTVIGSGGIGKSRLVQQLLPALAASFDSVTFVPLEAVTQSSEIGARIAREPKLELQRNATPLEQVKKALHTRHALLVLNSFEHLLEAEAMVGDLLAACPEVKLVVTSRVRLNRSGEWLLPLNGLAFPGLEDEDRAESFDAVHLFVDRARRAKPAFSLNTESRVVCEVTRLVEGMPLALEVAAAWTRLLPCRDIAGEIRAGSDLLRADDPSRPARQASVEATLEHSWRLLAPAERAALARMAAFRGGRSRDAAKEIAEASLPILASLTEKSLLRADKGQLSLHTQIQAFALRKLEEMGADRRALGKLWRAIGLTPAQMRAWHAEFESRNGPAHQEFLRSIGLGRAEIGRIRKWCATQV